MKKYLLLILVLFFVCLPAVAQRPAQRYPLGSMVDYSDPLADGLVGWWRFAEGMGNKVWDSSGNNITGTLYGFDYPPATEHSGWLPWEFGRALTFEGTDNYIDLGGGAPWEHDSVGTVTAWVTLGANFAQNDTRTLFGSNDSGDALSLFNFSLWNTLGGDFSAYLTVGCFEGGKQLQVRSTIAFPHNEFHFVAFVQDGIAIKIYTDVAEQPLVHSGTVDHGAWFDTVTDIDFNAIGADKRSGAVSRFWDGFIDDVRVYNRPLTESELTDLFIDHNRPLFPPGIGLSMSGALPEGAAQVIIIE